MDKSKSPPLSPRERTIKIKLLDIFPSINELIQKQKELDIIFQGLDIFYNLYELLENKTELTINIRNKNSIIISLIKSNNIFATCFYTIKQGEQWITFSYENKKKKEASFAQSLIDCIKIKLNCEFSQNKHNNKINTNLLLNTKKLNNNNKNNYLKQNSNYSSLTTEENFRITNNKMNKIFSNKGLKNISLECSPKEKLFEKDKYSYIKFEYSKNNKSNKELNTLKTFKAKMSKNKINNDNINLRINKIIDTNNTNEESKLNLTQNTKKKNVSNNNLDILKNSNKNLNIYNKDNKLYNNFELDTNKRSKQIIKNKLLNTNTYNNELNIGKKLSNKNKNKNKLEKSQENIESLYITNSINGALTNRNNKGSKKEIKNENTCTIKTSKTPIITKNNKFQNQNISIDKNDKYSPQYKSNDSSSNLENESDNNNKNNDDIDKTSDSDDFINVNNGYEKLKEDLILMYHDNYVKNVQEDLLKLEIELFIEKMTALISAYQFEMNQKKLINKIIEKKLKKNENEYYKLKKLYYKLKLIRKKLKQNNDNLNKNRINIKLINDKEFEINKKEINLFNLFYPLNSDTEENIITNITNKRQKLKNIMNIILSKQKNKTILPNNDLYDKFLEKEGIKEKIVYFKQKDQNEEEKIKYKYAKPKARTRIIPKSQHTQFGIKNNNNITNDKNNANINNSNINHEDKKDNISEHNYNTNVPYNKRTFQIDVYNPNKTYSRKIAK